MDYRKPWLCHASLRYYVERQTSKAASATSVPPAPDTQAPQRSASDISDAALKSSVVIVQLLLMGVIGKRRNGDQASAAYSVGSVSAGGVQGAGVSRKPNRIGIGSDGSPFLPSHGRHRGRRRVCRHPEVRRGMPAILARCSLAAASETPWCSSGRLRPLGIPAPRAL